MRKVLVAAGAVAAMAAPMAAISSSPAGAASSNTFSVTATEYTYKMSGSPKPGNVEITFKNGGVELHMMAVQQLKPGVTLKQVNAALASSDQAGFAKIAAGDPNGVLGAPNLSSPGVSTTTLTNLKAGHYVALCFVPAADGKPHFMHGMVKLFDVSGSKSTVKPPTDGVVDVTITDSGITLPSSGLPKSGWIKVTNNATAAQDLTLAKYTGSNTDFASVNDEVNNFFNTGAWSSGSAPVLLNGGVSGIAPGGTGYVEVSGLASGKWVAVSSVQSDQSNSSTPLHTDFTVS